MPSPPNDHYALVGKRLGFRLAYIDALHDIRETYGIFRLDDQPVKVRYQSVTIHDVINDTPDTCALTIDAATPPTVGQRLTIRLNANKPRTLFAGPLQNIGLTFELQPHQTVYPCQAIDDTPRANRKLPYGQWTNTSATIVAQWLVATFAPGFSAAAVQANLPPVSVNFDASEGMDGCLRQLAKLIGGYFYWDDQVLHLFTDETTEIPDPIDDTHPFLLAPPIAVATDTSQVRTRVYGKGYAEEIIADVAAGDPIVPISNAVMFNPAGGQAVTETQRLRYTGTTPSGGGTVVGPGVGPAAAPAAAVVTGAGITPGTHDYAVSFTTAAGESLLSPRVSLAVGTLPPPALPIAVATKPGGAGPDAGTHQYAVSFLTATGETLPSALTAYTQPTIAASVGPVYNIVDQNDGNGYGAFPYMKPGDHLVICITYTADPTDRQAPFPADGETPYSPLSAGYILKQGPFNAQNIMNFAFAVPFSPDPNVKFIHLWFSINFTPFVYVNYLTNTLNIQNQPGQTAYNAQFRMAGPQPTTAQQAAFNPILGGVTLSAIPTGPVGVTGRKLWRTAAGGTQLKFVSTLADNTTTTALDNKPDSALGANAPTVGTATAAQVQLSAIPIGAGTVTGRKVYRTAANAAQLKLLTTLADNVTTAYLDALADASLGANAPTGDTSGLKQPDGVALAGDTSIIVAGAGWAVPGGGWAIIGNGQQAIRYTGITGNTLTGIPPTGPGAITATVSYNSTITGAAALLGVTGLLRALIKGAPINLWVQRDDLAAQAALAAVDHTDGIIEHLITDERRGETSLTQLCDADLAQYAQPIQTVPYATRDPKTKSGKPITFNLASPAIHATLTIQEVTITEINFAPRLNPKFTVTASSVRFSLEDILRRLGANLDVTS